MPNLLAKYVIQMDPRTKKNNHRISGSGPRCPACGKYKKQFIRNGSTTTDFSFYAVNYIRPKPLSPFTGPVLLVYRIYTQTRRRVDDLNLFESLDDILVSAKVLQDDNRNVIRSRDGSRVFYDPKNPRAEIYIYDYKEEEDPHVHGNQDVYR